MPLEDELEALCRLHTARAELVLSGDVEDFVGRAPMVEAYAFRDEALVGGSAGEGAVLDVPALGANASCVQASSRGGDADGASGGAGVGAVGTDGRLRRLAALENCLDAFDRYIYIRGGCA